ncbi:hypothetical protein TNCV_4489701 [Trichonephila clavipes]|nr:hypothetical protein TNCV_4489701 [Trichonephila clavipes]
MTRFPPEEWLHIYTDGSLLDFAQGAGIGVFSHHFSFYLHAGPLTTHFDVAQRYTKQMAHIEKSLGSYGWFDMSQTNSEVNLVPRPKHNTTFVGFTRVNNQRESNNIQGNA